jgi:HSP20 family protein
MSMSRRPSPVGELLSLRQAMDRLFEESFVRPRAVSGIEGGQPMPLDIYATQDALVVEAALPGVRPEDVDITVTGDTLTISASSSEERSSDDAGVLYQEIRRGSMSRTVTLPDNLKADEATASFENGIIRLEIPKAEEARPRQIRISPSTDASTARTVSPPEGTATGGSSSSQPGGNDEGR